MTLKVAQEEFSQLWAEWEALLGQSCMPAVFQTPLWHRIWWQELGGEEKLCLITVRDDGELVGIAPLMSRGDTLLSLGDPDLCDYQGFVVAGGREEEFYPALFDHLREWQWTQMDLPSIPGDSSILKYFPNMATAQGYAVDVTEQDVSPGISLPPTWDDYLMGLSKKDRHELRRKLRRLEREGPYDLYSVNGTSLLDGGLDDFFRLMRDSRQDKAIFLTPERERFFRRMAEGMASANVLKLFFLELSGKRVASALCFDYGQVRFLYNAGYDPEYASLSVGLLIKAMCLKQAIEEGKAYFDFLRGNERYKYDLGARDVQVYRLSIHR